LGIAGIPIVPSDNFDVSNGDKESHSSSTSILRSPFIPEVSGEVKCVLQDCVTIVEIREKQRIDTDEWYESLSPLLTSKSLVEVFAAFGYTVYDKLEHREIIMMYRGVEKVMEYEIQRLNASDSVGSESHARSKQIRIVLTLIREEFDSIYSLTKHISVLPRTNISTISDEKFFKYDYETGKVAVNFSAKRIPELPHYLVVFRSFFVSESLRDLLIEENGFSEVKNNEPLAFDTIRSIIWPEYSKLQASGYSQCEQILIALLIL